MHARGGSEKDETKGWEVEVKTGVGKDGDLSHGVQISVKIPRKI